MKYVMERELNKELNMQIELMGINLNKELNIKDINEELLNQFRVTSIDEGIHTILRGKPPVNFLEVRFRVNIYFFKDILEKISLIALKGQVGEKYLAIKDVKELHEVWLKNNYGMPDKINSYGYEYLLSDFHICSEYDPRSGSAEIFYLFNRVIPQKHSKTELSFLK